MKIYLIRHGELDWKDGVKKCIGHTDIPLNHVGIKRAYDISNYLYDKKIDFIYSSDLIRCSSMAKIISTKLNVSFICKKELREINMGIWENMSFEEIKKIYPYEYEQRGKFISKYKIENGESFEECSKRSMKIFKEICSEGYENIVIISHCGINKCILSNLQNISIEGVLKVKQDYGCINVIEYDGYEFVVEKVNISLERGSLR